MLLFSMFFVTSNQTKMKMEQNITSSSRYTKLLNNFLRVMVVALVGILIAVVVTMLLWAVGVF